MKSINVIISGHTIIAIIGMSTIGIPFSLISYCLVYIMNRKAGIFIDSIVSFYVAMQYSNMIFLAISIIHPSLLLFIIAILFIFTGTCLTFVTFGEIIRYIVSKRLQHQ